jgi:cyclase
MFRINSGIFLDHHRPFLTKNFKPTIYLGNPRNALEVFSSLGYHELTVFSKNLILDEKTFKFLEWVASGSKVPLLYGGQITSVEEAIKIIELGFEKISIQSLYFLKPNIAKAISEIIGKQSFVLSLDCYYDELSNNWLMKNNQSLEDFLVNKRVNISEIFGEVVVNSITHNGCFNFFKNDPNKMLNFRKQIPEINFGYSGGLNSIEDLEVLSKQGFDSSYIYSSSTLSPNRKTKIQNSNVLRNL